MSERPSRERLAQLRETVRVSDEIGVEIGSTVVSRELLAEIDALTQERDETTLALGSLLEEKRLPNGDYVHHVICSGDRREMAGTNGISCCCLPTTHKAMAECDRLAAALREILRMLNAKAPDEHLIPSAVQWVRRQAEMALAPRDKEKP